MKKMINILLLSLFVCFSAVSQGKIQSANGWDFLEDPGVSSSWTDSIKTKSILSPEGQIFLSYGGTSFATRAWMMQTTWTKILPNLVTPDTVSIEAKFVGGEIAKVRLITMRIAIQYGFGYAMLINKTISMNSQWETISWNMKSTKDFGIKLISRFYLVFQFYSDDSYYVGGDIVVKNLKGVDSSGKISNIDFPFIVTKVPELTQIPSEFVLEQNYPNPFNPSTTIRFTVPKREHVNLTVFDFLGREVKVLLNQEEGQGSYQVKFDGLGLPSGTYFYKLQVGANV